MNTIRLVAVNELKRCPFCGGEGKPVCIIRDTADATAPDVVFWEEPSKILATPYAGCQVCDFYVVAEVWQERWEKPKKPVKLVMSERVFKKCLRGLERDTGMGGVRGTMYEDVAKAVVQRYVSEWTR